MHSHMNAVSVQLAVLVESVGVVVHSLANAVRALVLLLVVHSVAIVLQSVMAVAIVMINVVLLHVVMLPQRQLLHQFAAVSVMHKSA
jgi:hypothetical protein